MPRIWEASVADHKIRLRQAIIEAAVEVVAEEGLAEVTMSHIAERAGVGRATIYNYFPDLEHILAAYVVEEFEGYHRRLDHELEGIADPLDRLSAYIRFAVDYFASPAHRFGSEAIPVGQFSPELAPQVGAAFASLHARMAGMVSTAIDAGVLRPELDPTFTAELINHMLGACREAVMSGRQTTEAAAAAAFSLLIDGAGTAAARRRHRRRPPP